LAGTVMVIVAVFPETRFDEPCVAPSSVKVTVPLGVAELAETGESVAVRSSVLPPSGVVVAGTRARVVESLDTVMVTLEDVAVV